MDDGLLIKQYAEHGSQEAFAEIVRRYVDMVYWACFRELRDGPLAEDATQAVFLLLARKASSLRGHVLLSGWLFQTAVFAAKNARRQEARRRQREQAVMQDIVSRTPEQAQDWEAVEPLLNDALSVLSPAEQDLLAQRFWQGRSLADIGGALGIKEDAARMRVNRALEKLRRWFAARDIALSLLALQAALPQAVRPAPVHLAAAVVRLGALSALASGPETPAHTLAKKVGLSMLRKQLTRQAATAFAVAALTIGAVDAVCVVSQSNVVRPAAQAQPPSQSLPTTGQTQAQVILNQMYATYAAMRSFRCAVTSREEPLSTAQDATYEIERPNKIRFQRATLLGEANSEHALAVSDGQTLFVTGSSGMAGASRFVKIPLDPAQGGRYLFADFGGMAAWGTEPDAGMPDALLGIRLHESDYPQMLPPQYSVGKPVTLDMSGIAEPVSLDVVIAHIPWRPGTPGRDWKGATEIVTYYIGHTDHLLYKLTAQDSLSPSDWDTRTEYINEMEINKPIPASDFTFSPPPGSKEVSNANDVLLNP